MENHYFCMGKSTISMAMFNCYVSSLEGKCPILGILNIAFKYLLEINNPQYLDDVQLGHLPSTEKFGKHVD